MGVVANDGTATSSKWSWEENKLFELALVATSVSGCSDDRWCKIASMIGGRKSAEEVRRHYEVLLEDLDVIESGRLTLVFDQGGESY